VPYVPKQESKIKSLSWRSCQLKCAERSNSLGNAHRQGKKRKEDAEQTEDNNAPEGIVVEGIAVVFPKLAKTSRFLGTHVMSQLTETSFEDGKLSI
jgi:uncharacterized phosphosugar-binding protein